MELSGSVTLARGGVSTCHTCHTSAKCDKCDTCDIPPRTRARARVIQDVREEVNRKTKEIDMRDEQAPESLTERL